MSEDERENLLEAEVGSVCEDLTNNETISSLIAGSNATGWGLDVFEISRMDFSDPAQGQVEFSYSLSGEQDDDKPWCGTEISGEASLIIAKDGSIKVELKQPKLDWPDSDEPEENE